MTNDFTACAVRACALASLLYPLAVVAQPQSRPEEALRSPVVLVTPAPDAASARPNPLLEKLLAEAIERNPEIRAARSEREAATQRVAPAGALDDPMIEAGILNLPATSWSLSREDMTMKMLGISQRFPYPGKRGLKQDVATLDSASLGHAYAETVNRVVRDVRVAFHEFALLLRSTRLVESNREIVRQLLQVADTRYAVGQGNQVDVFRGQTELSKLSEALLKLEREHAVAGTELAQVLGRDTARATVDASLDLREVGLDFPRLREEAMTQRPQLLALDAMVARSRRTLALARTERYPDFDVRVSYGQRDRMPGGPGRSDLLSFSVAMNLPIWERNKNQPRIAEAAAMQEQAESLLLAQRNETAMRLEQQVATAQRSLRTVRLYRNEMIPQARSTIEAALAAYQVGRSDFALLLDNQMAVLDFQLAEAAAVAAYNKALAEIDLLTGRIVPAAAAAGLGATR